MPARQFTVSFRTGRHILHCRTFDTQTKAKSLPLLLATPIQNRGLKSKTTKIPEFNFGRGQVSAWLKNRCSLTADKKEIQDKFKNMSADNLPRWTKFEAADNSGLLIKNRNRIYISFTFFYKRFTKLGTKEL
jgi:hypothetical protein